MSAGQREDRDVDQADTATGRTTGAAAAAGTSLRARIASARRVVVKFGSSSLTDADHRVDPARIDRFVDALARRIGRGAQVIVVSSGAVAAGMGPLGISERPGDVATKQAVAAVGQVHLVNEWSRSFARHGVTAAQVLLTAGDAGRRERARNAQRALARLARMGTVPVINENDTVATSEFRFGDNDRLAAIVANLTKADALVLLSDVDGLYDRNPADPAARFVAEVRSGRDLAGVTAGGGSAVGTGGMASKVSAARLATRGGVPVLLTSAAHVDAALADAQVGTVFHPRPQRALSAWKFWALYAADAEGTLHLDRGAVAAVTAGGTSLLPVGVTAVDGEFDRGDIVDILGPDGQVVGRGEVGYPSGVLREMLGRHTDELPADRRRAVVHADYLSNFASRL